MEQDWRTTALASAAALTVAAAAWRYFLWPFFRAVWAAILAAPQIRDDLRDLPELIQALRDLIADDLPGKVTSLEARIIILEAEVNRLRSPAIAGGEGGPTEPFMRSES